MTFTPNITYSQYKKKLLKTYKQSLKNNNQEAIQFFEFLLNIHEIEIKQN